MLFRRYLPAVPLSSFIQNLWLYQGYESGQTRERIFPSGTVELVFNLRENKLRIYGSGEADKPQHYSGAIVSGPYCQPFGTDSEEETSVMGVHFRPGGAFPLLGLQAHELADCHTDLENLWGPMAAESHERLAAAASPFVRFRLLEQLLLLHLGEGLRRHSAVSQALETFERAPGRMTTRQMARDAGLSEKRFIDLFRSAVGLTPKVFHRISRFQRVLGAVHGGQFPDWSDLALRLGYFDQSHLICDFLAFSGLSPADYLRRVMDLRRRGAHIKINHLPLAS